MNEQTNHQLSPRTWTHMSLRARRGATLLMVLFTMLFTSVVLTGLLNSVRIQVTEQAMTQSYERANYLAGAGVHAACAALQNNMSWRTGIPSTAFPTGTAETYAATVQDGPDGSVIITGIGVAGGVQRVLRVSIQ